MSSLNNKRFKFTKASLAEVDKKINQGDFDKETFLHDTDSRLALRVRPGQSYLDCAFYLVARIRVSDQYKSRLYKRHIVNTAEARNSNIQISELRRRSDKLFLDIQSGNDPVEIVRKEKEKLIAEANLTKAKSTLKIMVYGEPLLEEEERGGFIAERQPSERYLIDINKIMKGQLLELQERPLYELTAEQVKTLYLKKVKKAESQLNGAMRVLRSIWNWAESKYGESGLFSKNPVSKAMKQLGININRTNRRTNRLDDQDFEPYLKSVLRLRAHDHTSAFRNGRDALLFMLFSSVRITGTLTIRVRDIDFQRRTFWIVKKGGKRAELPLNTVTEVIVKNRLANLPNDIEYLFPGVSGTGHYYDTKQVREIVEKNCGVSVTNHDLRRTYKSIGTELGIHPVLVDELLTHERAGVDAHYIHPSLSKLREASQRIADYMTKQANINVEGELTAVW